jgi:hypothetical protein
MEMFIAASDPAAPKPPHRHGTWRDLLATHPGQPIQPLP